MAKSPHVTEEGFQALRAEAKALWAKRQDVVAHLSAAAAEGDRSENAEYIYRKKQLRELDRRIRYLQKRLPELKVVPPVGQSTERVFFGAWITVRDDAGVEIVYRIVGGDEFDPKRNWISVDSPVARALLKRVIDDEVEVRTPGGLVRYVITEIRY